MINPDTIYLTCNKSSNVLDNYKCLIDGLDALINSVNHNTQENTELEYRRQQLIIEQVQCSGFSAPQCRQNKQVEIESVVNRIATNKAMIEKAKPLINTTQTQIDTLKNTPAYKAAISLGVDPKTGEPTEKTNTVKYIVIGITILVIVFITIFIVKKINNTNKKD